MLVSTEAVASSFCGSQQSSCFFLSKYNLEHHYLISPSSCYCHNWPIQTHTLLHFSWLRGEKDRGIVHRTLAIGWDSGAIHHQNPLLPTFLQLTQMWELSRAPLLKSLTSMRPLEMARNNMTLKYYTCRDGVRQWWKIPEPTILKSANSFTWKHTSLVKSCDKMKGRAS